MKFLHHFHLSENFKWKAWDLQPLVVFSASSTKNWIHKSVKGFSQGTPISCLADSHWLWLSCTNSVSVECLWAGVWMCWSCCWVLQKFSPQFSLRINCLPFVQCSKAYCLNQKWAHSRGTMLKKQILHLVFFWVYIVTKRVNGFIDMLDLKWIAVN